MSLDIQALTIVHMSVAGFYLGAAIDTYMRLWPIRSWMVRIGTDVLFWVVQAVLVFTWLQAINNGHMRIYVFAALLLGYAAYRSICQSAYQRLLERLIGIVRAILHGVGRVIRTLIISPMLMVWRLIVSIFALIGAGFLYLGVGSWRILRGLGKMTIIPLITLLARHPIRQWFSGQSHPQHTDDERRQDEHPTEIQKKERKKRGFFARIANWFGKRHE